jgi:hypothetical protein
MGDRATDKGTELEGADLMERVLARVRWVMKMGAGKETGPRALAEAKLTHGS